MSHDSANSVADTSGRAHAHGSGTRPAVALSPEEAERYAALFVPIWDQPPDPHSERLARESFPAALEAPAAAGPPRSPAPAPEPPVRVLETAAPLVPVAPSRPSEAGVMGVVEAMAAPHAGGATGGAAVTSKDSERDPFAETTVHPLPVSAPVDAKPAKPTMLVVAPPRPEPEPVVDAHLAELLRPVQVAGVEAAPFDDQQTLVLPLAADDAGTAGREVESWKRHSAVSAREELETILKPLGLDRPKVNPDLSTEVTHVASRLRDAEEDVSREVSARAIEDPFARRATSLDPPRVVTYAADDEFPIGRGRKRSGIILWGGVAALAVVCAVGAATTVRRNTAPTTPATSYQRLDFAFPAPTAAPSSSPPPRPTAASPASAPLAVAPLRPSGPAPSASTSATPEVAASSSPPAAPSAVASPPTPRLQPPTPRLQPPSRPAVAPVVPAPKPVSGVHTPAPKPTPAKAPAPKIRDEF